MDDLSWLDDIAPAAAPENDSWEITKGVKSGTDQLQATGYGLAGLVGDALGVDSLKDWGVEGYERNIQEAGENQGNITRYEDVKSFGDAADYVLYGMGQQLPMLAATIGSGGVGALAGRSAAKKGIQEFIERETAERVSKGITEGQALREVTELAGKRITAGAAKGGTGGAFAAGSGIESGSIYGDMAEELGDDADPYKAAIGGLVAGSLEILPVGMILKRAGLTEAAQDGVAALIKESVPQAALKQFLAEGSTEALQTIIEKATVQWAGGQKEIFSEEGLSEIKNAALLGGITGGAIGGGVKALQTSPMSGLEQAREAAAAAGGDALAQNIAAAGTLREAIVKRKEEEQKLATSADFGEYLKTVEPADFDAPADLETKVQPADLEPLLGDGEVAFEKTEVDKFSLVEKGQEPVGNEIEFEPGNLAASKASKIDEAIEQNIKSKVDAKQPDNYRDGRLMREPYRNRLEAIGKYDLLSKSEGNTALEIDNDPKRISAAYGEKPLKRGKSVNPEWFQSIEGPKSVDGARAAITKALAGEKLNKPDIAVVQAALDFIQDESYVDNIADVEQKLAARTDRRRQAIESKSFDDYIKRSEPFDKSLPEESIIASAVVDAEEFGVEQAAINKALESDDAFDALAQLQGEIDAIRQDEGSRSSESYQERERQEAGSEIDTAAAETNTEPTAKPAKAEAAAEKIKPETIRQKLEAIDKKGRKTPVKKPKKPVDAPGKVDGNSVSFSDDGKNSPLQSEKRGSNGRQKGATAAISDAEKEIGYLKDRHGVDIVASVMPKEWVKGGTSKTLLGQTIRTPQQLGAIAQIYRNPKFETLRIVLTKSKGILEQEIVGESAVSTRMPASASSFADDEPTATDTYRQMMERVGADGYFFIHNHPSGDPTPSKADIKMTRSFSENLIGFQGHVVINHTKASNIDEYGDVKQFDIPEDKKVKLNTRVKDHMLIGEDIDGPISLSVHAARARRSESDSLTLIASSNSGIKSFAHIPMSEFMKHGKNKIKLLAKLRKFALASSSEQIFVAGMTDNVMLRARLSEAIQSGVITDAVSDSGESLTAGSGVVREDFYSVLGRQPRSVRVQDTTLRKKIEAKKPAKTKSPSDVSEKEANYVREDSSGYKDPYSEAYDKLANKDKTIKQKVKETISRELLPEGGLPREVFEQKMDRDSDMNAEEHVIRSRLGRFDKAIKGAYQTSYGKLADETKSIINDALGGADVSLPTAVADEVAAMRANIRGLSKDYVQVLQSKAQQAVDMGDIDGAAERQMLIDKIIGNYDKYVHRSYRAFDDPEWPTKVPEDVYRSAVKYFESKGRSFNDAKKTVELILTEGTAYQSVEAFIQESKLGAKDLSVLKKKNNDIAPEILSLLGEYKDAKINYAKTISKMSHLVANEKFLERVRELGLGTFLSEADNRTDGHTEKLAGIGSETMSPLNGLYTTPEIAKAFRDALGKENLDGWLKKIIQINGFAKYGKTVLSPTTALRNFMSSAFFAMGSGHFDIRHAGKSWGAAGEYFTNASSDEQMKYLKKLHKLGVIYDNPTANEMMDLMRESNIENILSADGKFGGIKKFNDLAQKFYGFGDDAYKIYGFENEKRLQMKHYKLSEKDAEIAAAERVRNTYPTYSLNGRFIHRLRRFPLAGTFVSFPAAVIRTSFHILKYAAQDMKHSKSLGAQRMVGLAMVSGGVYAAQAISKAMLGVDDEEEEAIKLLAAPWSKNSNLLYTGRDKNGNIEYIDLTFADAYGYWKRPINAFLRDQPMDEALKSGASDLLTPFFGADMVFSSVMEVYQNKKSTGGRVFNPDADVVDQTADIGNHLRKVFQPGFVNNIERTYRALDGQVTPSGRRYDFNDEMMALAGLRVTTFDPKVSLYYRSFGFKDQKSNASRILTSVLRNPNKVNDGDITAAYKNAGEVRLEAYKDMAIIVSAARKAGLSRMQAIKVLRDSGISKADASALVDGEAPKWKLSTQMKRNASKRARVLFDEATATEFDRRYDLLNDRNN